MWSSIKQNWSSARDSSSGVPTDVTIQVQVERKIHKMKAHKYYLALGSSFFKTHFFGPFGGNKDVVQIDASVQAVEAVIDFIYLKDLYLEKKNLEEILEIARVGDFYDVVGMMQVVKDFVEKRPISLDNVVETAHIADMFSIVDDISQLLLSKCTKFLSQVLCSHVIDFSGLFSKSEFASSAALLHRLVLEVDLPDCSNCDHFPCLHGQLVPDDGWAAGSDFTGDAPFITRGCLVIDDEDNHWTVFGFEPGDEFFNGRSEGEVVLFARKTTFTTDGEPHLHKHEDVQINLADGTYIYFECRKLGGAVPEVHLPKKDCMNMWSGDTDEDDSDSD